MRRAIGETVSLEVSADPELWSSNLDPAQFESAILNLAINARDAMPNGGRLIIGARNVAFAEIEAKRFDLRPGEYVVVRVTDNGAGMTPEIQHRAFEPFFTTKDVGKGTGLGLAQIYGFAKQSDGTAAIDSAPGRGTTVALYLPRADAQNAEEGRPASERLPALGHGKTILVIEDQADIREVNEVFLDGLDYRILTAPDGITASKVLESEEQVDLLLTDVMMPNGANGLDLARQARQLRQDLKIVVVSGYPCDLESRAGGVSSLFFLEKPFRRAELAGTIAAALGDSRR